MERVSDSYSVAISQKEACLKIKGADKSFDLIGRLSTLADSHDLTIYSVSEYIEEDDDSSSCNRLCLEAYIGYKDIDRLKNAVAELKEESGAASSTIDVDLAKLSIIGRALSRETLNKLVRTLKEAGVSPRKIEFSDTKISCLIDSLKGAFASNLVHDSLNAGLIKSKVSVA